eukprot:3860291-Rhodomonas_salina.1
MGDALVSAASFHGAHVGCRRRHGADEGSTPLLLLRQIYGERSGTDTGLWDQAGLDSLIYLHFMKSMLVFFLVSAPSRMPTYRNAVLPSSASSSSCARPHPPRR